MMLIRYFIVYSNARILVLRPILREEQFNLSIPKNPKNIQRTLGRFLWVGVKSSLFCWMEIVITYTRFIIQYVHFCKRSEKGSSE